MWCVLKVSDGGSCSSNVFRCGFRLVILFRK